MAVSRTFDAIKSLLHSHKIQHCHDSKLHIREKDKKATLRSVSLDSVGASAFYIQYDECKFPGETLFAPHDSLHRACDAIAFCEVDSRPYIMCIELKSSEPERHEVAQQFRGAHCFLDYLDALLNNYCKGETIKDWECRYFVFHSGKTPMAKRRSVEEFDNTSPDSVLFMPTENGDKHYLRRLLGKPR